MDRHQVGGHQVLAPGFGIRQNQRTHGDHALDFMGAARNVAGVDGLLIHTDAADMLDGLPGGPGPLQLHKLRGHDRAGRILRILENLVDHFPGIRIGLGENPRNHVGGHFLHQLHGVVHIQLLHHGFQLRIRKTADEDFLLLRLHLHKGLRRQFLGQQTEYQRQRLLGQRPEGAGDIRRVQRCQKIPQRGVLFCLRQLHNGIFQHNSSFFQSASSLTNSLKFDRSKTQTRASEACVPAGRRGSSA